MPDSALLSQGGNPQVSLTLEGLTSVFGMGTGISPPPWPSDKSIIQKIIEIVNIF